MIRLFASVPDVVVVTSEGRAYDVTGREALDPTQRAAIFAELGDRPVEVVDVDDTAFASASSSTPAYRRSSQRPGDLRCGRQERLCRHVSDLLEHLTGRSPRTVREVLAEALA